MTKIKLFIILAAALRLCSCIPVSSWEADPPKLNVSVNSGSEHNAVIKANEDVTVKAAFYKGNRKLPKNFIIYAVCNEDFSKNCEVKKGVKYSKAQWMPENCLCIMPEEYDEGKYITELLIKFDIPGEYTVKINGCDSSKKSLEPYWDEKDFTCTFTVKDEE